MVCTYAKYQLGTFLQTPNPQSKIQMALFGPNEKKKEKKKKKKENNEATTPLDGRGSVWDTIVITCVFFFELIKHMFVNFKKKLYDSWIFLIQIQI